MENKNNNYGENREKTNEMQNKHEQGHEVMNKSKDGVTEGSKTDQHGKTSCGMGANEKGDCSTADKAKMGTNENLNKPAGGCSTGEKSEKNGACCGQDKK